MLFACSPCVQTHNGEEIIGKRTPNMCVLAKVIRSDFGTHCKALVSAVQRINNRKRTFHYLEPSIHQQPHQHVCKRLSPREAECKNEGIHRKLFNSLLNYKFHYKNPANMTAFRSIFFFLINQPFFYEINITLSDRYLETNTMAM